jgi:hypothetical protein
VKGPTASRCFSPSPSSASAASSFRLTTTSRVSARSAIGTKCFLLPTKSSCRRSGAEGRLSTRRAAHASWSASARRRDSWEGIDVRGLFSRVRGDVFVLAPPFVTTDDQLDRLTEILAVATKAVLG